MLRFCDSIGEPVTGHVAISIWDASAIHIKWLPRKPVSDYAINIGICIWDKPNQHSCCGSVRASNTNLHDTSDHRFKMHSATHIWQPKLSTLIEKITIPRSENPHVCYKLSNSAWLCHIPACSVFLPVHGIILIESHIQIFPIHPSLPKIKPPHTNQKPTPWLHIELVLAEASFFLLGALAWCFSHVILSGTLAPNKICSHNKLTGCSTLGCQIHWIGLVNGWLTYLVFVRRQRGKNLKNVIKCV